ncbi:uncharacterized protein LOC114516147 [Dendronephthya gigantea]|uniref:uncharacterized protein LOC114516147 n=1 Tax=Dendronephthya gigantea TaxID=151771 RepID=UPI00106B3FF5|nr:uncharacterized protein LOC114516147 [Dendronephthya gigantea]
MATEEDVFKKARRTRTIELDLCQFPAWVGEASDAVLLELFAIGVKVKESITINITETPDHIQNIVGEKLKPVYDKVGEISQKFVAVQNEVTTSLTKMHTGVSEMQVKLVSDIHEVASKVPSLESLNTTLGKRIDAIQSSIRHSDDNLTKLVTKYENPAIKGALGEDRVESILQAYFPTYTIYSVASQGRKADIQITSAHSRQKYLVEVKDRQNEVPAKDIERFEKNVVENKDFKVGILFSLRSGISVRASQGRFKIKYQDEQYYIYVPNAITGLTDGQNLIIWIVLLADQLASLNQGLNNKQTEAVENLLQEFQQSAEASKNCRTHLNALRGSVEALEKDLVPLLKLIDNAKRKLNRALNKDG